MEIAQALQKALEFEKKGHDIYENTANTTHNPIVANTFRYLAEQELNHIESIKRYVAKLDDSSDVELTGDTPEDTDEFFTMTVSDFKEDTELSDDDLKVHELALKLEQSAYDFYKKQYDDSDEEKLKEFFSFLMAQENAHYKLIQDAYNFIKDPESFFVEEEGRMMDGG